eukprot:scaffold10874_cov120-Skeletonema_marinoi.AAC.1
MHGERRGHILLFSLTFATNDGGSRTATSVKAVESESSRTEHEMVLKYRDGTYGNSPLSGARLSDRRHVNGSVTVRLQEHTVVSQRIIIRRTQSVIIQSEKCRTLKGSNAILGSTSTDGLSSALEAHGHIPGQSLSIRALEHFRNTSHVNLSRCSKASTSRKETGHIVSSHIHQFIFPLGRSS